MTAPAAARPASKSLPMVSFRATAERRDLRAAVGAVWRAEGRMLGILDNIHLSADGAGLVVRTYDYSIEARSRVPAEVAHAGEALLPGRALARALRLMDDGPIEILAEGDYVSLTYGAAGGGTWKHNYKAAAAADYPKEHPPERVERELVIGSTELAAVLRGVLPFVDAEDTRPILSGVAVSVRDGHLEFAAADGFRLALVRGPAAESWGPEPVVLTHEGLRRVLPLLRGPDREVRIAWSPSPHRYWVTVDETVVSGDLVAGTYPKYDQLIPQDLPWRLQLPASALRRVGALARDYVCVRMEWSPSTGLDLWTRDDGEGLRVRLLAGIETTGSERRGRCGLQPNYLLDAAAAYAGDLVIRSTDSPTNPVLFESPDGALRVLVMPMYVDWSDEP